MNQQTHKAFALMAILTVSAGAILIGTGCSQNHVALDDVIEPKALADLMQATDRDRLLVVDVRDGDAYAAAHVSDAIHVDAAAWKKETFAADTDLDHKQYWTDRIGAIGINGRDPVVIYDDGRMTEAARIWFVLQHFGAENVGVVNGGYAAMAPLMESGRITTSTSPAVAKQVTFVGNSRHSVIALIDRDELKRTIDNGTARVLDSRTEDEFTGRELRSNSRGGHLPSAVNLSHTLMLDETGRLKSVQELTALFEQAGFQRGTPIITHCQSGGRASLAALAAHRAGFGPVMNYYLSFGDWAADASCPVTTDDD